MMHLNHRKNKAGSKEFAWRKRDRNWAYGVKMAYKRASNRRLRQKTKVTMKDIPREDYLEALPKFKRDIQRLIDWY